MPPKRKVRRERKIKVKDVTSGRKFSPPGHPPLVAFAHWVPATICHTTTADTELSINDLCNQLRDQYGLFATDNTNRIPIAVKFHSISAWQTPISVIATPFILIVRDTVTFGDLVKLIDWPASNQWARVGFEWPLAQQAIEHDHAKTDKLIKVDVRAQGTVVVYVKVLWRALNGISVDSILGNLGTQSHVCGCSSNFSELNLEDN